MNLILKTFTLLAFLLSSSGHVLYAQELSVFNLTSDTSGYIDYSEEGANNPDVIPTINGELNINEQGALTYTIPIEVYKGVNDFQPNIALAYNSQSGNGQAGIGWNIIGLSSITTGGKIKKIDGINQGIQYDDTDPYYLDGQRLIRIGNTDNFETEQYSQIKITKSDENTFKIQYTDGKIAIYKLKALGQYLITQIQDANNNKIFYNYTVSKNVPYLSSVKYGGNSNANSPFSILFSYNVRTVPSVMYRNGIKITNEKFLKDISVSSSNSGIHRKYLLEHDLTSTKMERLRKIEVENGLGERLRPLIINYNTEMDGLYISRSTSNAAPLKADTKYLGNVAYGDFEGNGEISANYLVNSSRKYHNNDPGQYSLINSKYGVFETDTDMNFNNRKLFNGRIIEANGIYSENDRLLQVRTSDRIEFVNVNGGYIPKRKYIVETKDNNPNTQSDTYYNLALGFDFEELGANYRIVDAFYFELTGDFNNDGLVDRIIFSPPAYIAKTESDSQNIVFTSTQYGNIHNYFLESKTSPKIYFYEIGKNINTEGELQPIVTSDIGFDQDSEAYIIEFNGDNIPEILLLNRTEKKFSVYKIENGYLIPVLENQLLDNFEKETPLIFGDFNGDGLTDFITPQKIYSIESSSVNQMVTKINSEQLKWRQYTSTGVGFIRKQQNFTDQKLAYCKPSQRNIIKKSSFWQKLWNGTQDEFQGTEYAACGVIPMDYNNDGKTDIVSFTKFGKIKYETNLSESKVTDNINPASGGIFANKLRFLENSYDETKDFILIAVPGNEISIAEDMISPLSLIVSNSDFRGMEGHKSGIKFIDPILRRELRFDINSNEFSEGRIKEISNGSGVIQQIEYAPLSTIFRNGNKVTAGIYYQTNTENLGLTYPYFVSKHQPFYLLVKRVNTLFDNLVISKEYRYENAIQNFDGKGFQGFQKTKVSDPYESRLHKGEYLPKNPFQGVMWKVDTYDPEFENAIIKTSYGSLDEQDLLTSAVNTYERYEKPNHQYTILNKSTVSNDFLKGIIITKSYTYRPSDLLLEEVVTNYNNESVSTTYFEYQPPFYSGDHFFSGKITLNRATIEKGSDSFTTKDEYVFNSSGSLSTHNKYGNDTTPLTTEFTYFANGNIKQEKVSGQGVAALTTKYAYESTNRYVNKITAPDGQISESEINDLGQVLSETSPFGLTVYYEYDHWGNKNKITDYLGIETVLIKEQLPDGKYSLATETPGTPKSIITFDRFDRQIQTKTQSINNKWMVTDIVYDIYGKKIKESEPYFDGESPSQWNIFEYDALDRVVEQQLYNGKIVTTCYEGMTVTVEDGEQKTSKTLDATGNIIKHTDMGGEILYDYYPNGTLKTANYDGIIISVEQDGWGNKTMLSDPSAGVYTYEYDIFGRLLTETTPKGETTYTYDNYGKLLTETSTGDETDIVANYTYDPATKLPKKITGSTGNGEHYFEYETFYDQYYRITGKKETHDAFVYQTSSEFDGFGRLKTTTLTTTVNHINKTTSSKVENKYEAGSGILIQQKDKPNSRIIWKTNQVNQKGQVLQTTYGNGFVLENTYNSLFFLTKIKHKNNTTSQTAAEINYNFDPVKKRLNSRNLVTFGKNELFDYDELDRLIKETVNNTVVNEYTYDQRGRMTYNTQVGYYEYNETDYKIKKFGFNANGQDLLTDRGFHQLKFNAFKQVADVYLPGYDRIHYDFNLFKKRSIAYYGSEDENKNNRPVRKYYTSDNAVEIIFDNASNTTQITTYIDGDPYSSSYIKTDKYNGSVLSSSKNYYLHRDYQGSIIALSDTDGKVVEQRYFDAWGNIQQVRHISWNGNVQTTTTDTVLGIIDRGYTGHEHLQSVGLIHMNGRLYDPVIRRFLSPDNFVQDPYNTQNFDRYGYVYNNPLMYADPSGEFFVAAAIAVAAAIVVNGIHNMINGIPFWYGMGKAGTMAAVSAVISFGIGSVTSTITDSVGRAMVQSVTHGVTGGIMSSIDGGKFGSGFAAGAVSSLVSSGVQAIGGTGGYYLDEDYTQLSTFGSRNPDLLNAMTIAAGGLSGGLSSTIAGGSFWTGARQGLITSGLNHVGHNVYKNIQENKLQKQLSKYSNLDVLLEGGEWGRERAFQILVDKVPILRKEYLRSIAKGGKITVDMKGGINKRDPNTMAETSGDPGWANITFYDLSFKDIYTFGKSIHHELIHVYHHVSGMYQGWLNTAGGDVTGLWYARYMSEHYAYKGSYLVTGDMNYYYRAENYLIDASNECKIWCK